MVKKWRCSMCINLWASGQGVTITPPTFSFAPVVFVVHRCAGVVGDTWLSLIWKSAIFMFSHRCVQRGICTIGCRRYSSHVHSPQSLPPSLHSNSHSYRCDRCCQIQCCLQLLASPSDPRPGKKETSVRQAVLMMREGSRRGEEKSSSEWAVFCCGQPSLESWWVGDENIGF